MKLSSVFEAEMPPSQQSPDPDKLDAALNAACASALSAYPTLQMDEASFISHVARHAPCDGDLLEWLEDLRIDELFLAWACLHEQALALSELDELLAGIARVVVRVDSDQAFTDEALQVLRERLLLARKDAPARIADFAGRGPLAAWLRVAAVRVALNLKRKEAREVLADDNTLLERAVESENPELTILRRQSAPEMNAAFAAALATLEPKERNLLRLYYLDELTIDEIGVLFNIHRATAARRIDRVRTRLHAETRTQLSERLALTDSELESLVRVAVSQLDVSLGRLLAD